MLPDRESQDVADTPGMFYLLYTHSIHTPWYRSLAEAFRRQEPLPPLELTSKPVPVEAIWGIYDYRNRSLFSSSLVHVTAVMLLFTALSRPQLPDVIRQSVDLAIPVDISRFLPTPPKDGGGGGGDHSPLEASSGLLPRFQLTQLTPPTPHPANAAPRLAVEPTLIGPADMKASLLDFSLLGDPLTEIGPPSAGPGSGGGIGAGVGTGVGNGKSGGYGPGEGEGQNGVFKVGGDVSAPVLRVKVDPEYSERARNQRLQGAVLLAIEVWPDGRAHNVRVQRGLGMGLDEKAVEAVRNWQFEPGTKDGAPVKVGALVEVIFQLF